MRAMPPGRKAKHRDLPPRMHLSDGAYYYVTTGKPRKWIKLSKDKGEALVKWAELEGAKIPNDATTFEAAWLRYEREIVPAKAPATQHDNRREAAFLLAFFGKMQLDAIRPLHVEQYMSAREAKVRATREKALMSHVFNCARKWGLTDASNPCAGIKGVKSKRSRHVHDEEFEAVYKAACQPLKDAMDLALLTGQRPSDVLGWARTDIRDGVLWIRQGKTGTALRIEVVGELATVIKRCEDRAKSYKVASLSLVLDEHGHPLRYWTMSKMFARARKAAGIADVQFRDLRAKNATESVSQDEAKNRLGHTTMGMTESYIRNRAGRVVKPLR